MTHRRNHEKQDTDYDFWPQLEKVGYEDGPWCEQQTCMTSTYKQSDCAGLPQRSLRDKYRLQPTEGSGNPRRKVEKLMLLMQWSSKDFGKLASSAMKKIEMYQMYQSCALAVTD